jgi:hypothetical protein
VAGKVGAVRAATMEIDGSERETWVFELKRCDLGMGL